MIKRFLGVLVTGLIFALVAIPVSFAQEEAVSHIIHHPVKKIVKKKIIRKIIKKKVIQRKMPSPLTTPASESVAPAPVIPAATEVHISGFAFAPASLTVKKGTTVKFIQDDSAPHNVVSIANGPAILQSSVLSRGQSFSFAFDTVGSFSYMCTIHPSMTGTVIVTE